MSIAEKGLRTREIITKAVCGKGRKFSQETHIITPANNPSSILGCWVINHSYSGKKVGDVIEIIGSYDINVWYSYANNTKTDVAKENVTYVDQVNLSYLDRNLRGNEFEVSVSVVQTPNAVEAKTIGSKCSVQVEREFSCEVIGETKVNVVVAPVQDDELDDKFDDYSDIEFDVLDDEVIFDDAD
jgi:spore coat protein E